MDSSMAPHEQEGQGGRRWQEACAQGAVSSVKCSARFRFFCAPLVELRGSISKGEGWKAGAEGHGILNGLEKALMFMSQTHGIHFSKPCQG